MRRVEKPICLLWSVLTCFLLMSFSVAASAQSSGNFTASASGGSIWVLNKSTGKLIFAQFKKKDEIWKSSSINIPPNYNLEQCQLQSFGRRGLAVLLFDISSGSATAYTVQSDHAIQEGIDLSFAPNDKKFIFTGRADNFWILNGSSRELLFLNFKNISKVKKSPPILVAQPFNLDECQLEPIGRNGDEVFLFDRSSGMTTYYKLKIQHEDGASYSIEEYLKADIGSELK